MFDPRSVEARLSLQRIHPEDMPGVACDALEAGFDGPTIRRMAGLINPSGYEVDMLLPAFMEQMQMRLLPKAQASLRVACDLARDIIESRKDPLEYARAFERLWIESDYSVELSELGQLDDQIYLSRTIGGKTEQQLRADTRDELILFVRSCSNLEERPTNP
jgi:hypothetical protein